MLDKSKNVCYIIHVHFFHKKKDGSSVAMNHRFISNHGISTKKFREFAEKELRERYNFEGFLDEWGSQETVANKDFCK